MRGVILGKYSSNGPGIEDCETLMRAIEGLHAGQVQLTVTPVGISATGGLGIVLTFTAPAVPSGKSGEPILVVSRFPDVHLRDFWSCIFNGLYQLDAMIGRRYGQDTIPQA